MTREEAIRCIEGLYPADTQHVAIAGIGEELLQQAKKDCSGWRAEPDDILIRYAQLCIRKKNEEIQKKNTGRKK